MHAVRRKGRRRDLEVRQLPIRLDKKVDRVVTLPFSFGTAAQVAEVFQRVERLSDDQVERALAGVLENFSLRHEDYEKRLEDNCALASRVGQIGDGLSLERKLLIGAYFTLEYSIEAAALFNPSIVSHPDQTGAPPGGQRFLMSLRAVGEGHLSSTVFQTGFATANIGVALDPPGSFSTRTRIKPDHHYVKPLFRKKLEEIGVPLVAVHSVLGRVEEEFTFDELEVATERTKQEEPELPNLEDALGAMIWLARANYELQLDADDEIGDLILFPRSESEARGIEDMRLVRFVDDDDSVTYYGTYTAFDGHRIMPMLMETKDFRTIRMHTLNGACVQNKGMALFPRRVDGHYAMVSRIDGRNLFLMFSDLEYFWETATLLAEPKYPWELRIMGNCGSPLETDEGWLLITHGVGPMRRYCIGAMLLDLEDPFQIRGRLGEPLLEPSEGEREGYTPNVVYSCGSMIHNGHLILPYAVSDTATRFATVPVRNLLDRLLEDGP